MKLTADESVDKPIVTTLRNHNFDVYYIAEESPSIEDVDVLSIARHRSEILLTQDKDFGELVYRENRPHTGVILIRLSGLSAEEKAHRVLNAILANLSQLEQAFTVIQKDTVRIKPRKDKY